MVEHSFIGIAENFPVGNTPGVGFSDPQSTVGICLSEGPPASADAVASNVATYAWKLVLAAIMVNQRDTSRSTFPVCSVPHGASANYALTADAVSHIVATELPEMTEEEDEDSGGGRRVRLDKEVQTDE